MPKFKLLNVIKITENETEIEKLKSKGFEEVEESKDKKGSK